MSDHPLAEQPLAGGVPAVDGSARAERADHRVTHALVDGAKLLPIDVQHALLRHRPGDVLEHGHDGPGVDAHQRRRQEGGLPRAGAHLDAMALDDGALALLPPGGDELAQLRRHGGEHVEQVGEVRGRIDGHEQPRPGRVHHRDVAAVPDLGEPDGTEVQEPE